LRNQTGAHSSDRNRTRTSHRKHLKSCAAPVTDPRCAHRRRPESHRPSL
jgi:hypothetical protein